MISLVPRHRRTRILLFLGALLATVTLYNSRLSRQHRHEIPPSFLTWEAELGHIDGQANTYVPEKASQEFCAEYKWKPYLPSPDAEKRKRKVYDLFMINDELDWLEIRLNTLHQQVDYFVVVESPRTFTGLDKPLHLKENWDRFTPFHDQIIHHVLDSDLDSTRTWDHEDLQRNAMYDQVIPFLSGPQAIHSNDVLLVSDIDEIPRPHTITILKTCAFPKRLTLRSKFYYYSFQWQHRGPDWPHPQATIYTGPTTIRPADLRNNDGPLLSRLSDSADLWGAAWHCSSCFSRLSTLLNKMSSFSHTSYNKQEFRDKAAIVRKIRNGLDLFDRKGEVYDKIERNLDVPRYIVGNVTRFAYLLDRDPINANFEDLGMAEAAVEAFNDARTGRNGGT